jgi:hypothetical protein
MFNSRTPGQLVNELNRNREMSPGHVPLQELLGKNNGKSVAPNIDKETGLPVAGKYLNNGQKQNAPGASGTLQEEEREEELGRESGQRNSSEGIS